MSSIDETIRRLSDDLRDAGTRWSLVGGLAVSVRTEPRFTRDVDVVVAVDDDAGAEALVRSLLARGYRVLATIEQEATARLAAVRLVPAGGEPDGVVVDLLFASSGIESELVASSELRELGPTLTVPVARTGHLIALKLLARDDSTRPLDAADLLALRDVADEAELERARQAVKLITERGYARGRDLGAALTALLSGRCRPG